MAVNTTPPSSADSTNPNQAKIKAWKDRLRAGNLTQTEINNLIKKVTAAGGKADPANFPKAGSTVDPTPPAKSSGGGGGGGGGGMKAATAKVTEGANKQDAGKIVQGEKGVSNAQANQSINKQNPSVITTPTGSQTVEMVNGRPVVTQTLSPEQQRILQEKQTQTNMGAGLARTALNEYQQFEVPDQMGAFKSTAPKVGYFDPNTDVRGFSSDAGPISNKTGTVWNQQYEGGAGADAAANNLIGGFSAFSQTGSDEERARIEDAVYKKLTKNVDRDYNKEFDAMEQRMYNRGIPLDPSNPAYKQEMDALNEKYANIKESASGQAVQMGGEELARTFGMGQAAHQQTVSDIGALSGVGQAAYAAKMGGQAQGFGQQMSATELKNAAQAQGFGQDVEAYQQYLAKQGQQFGEQLSASQQRAAQQAQQFGQDVTGYTTNLAGNAQNYGQDLAAHQQGMTDINQLQNMGTGLLMPNLPGYQAPTMQQTPAAQVGVGISGQQVSKDNAQLAADTQKTVTQMQIDAAAAAAAAASGSDNQDQLPT
jgi:hypothetical protein